LRQSIGEDVGQTPVREQVGQDGVGQVKGLGFSQSRGR